MTPEPQQPHEGIYTSGAFLLGIHPYAFRSGKPALIVCVKWVEAPTPRPCFEIVFPDGKIDWVPVSEIETGNYKIVAGVP